jgi:hypothetical protein
MSLSIDEQGGIAILRGPLSAADLGTFVRMHPTRLIVHAAPDLEFLRDLPALRSLEVHHLPLADVRPIESQRSLEHLSLNAYFRVNVDFSGLARLRTAHLDWGPGAETVLRTEHLEDLSFNRFPHKDLRLLATLRGLKKLRLAGGRLASLDGIGALVRIEELRLLDLRALSNIESIRGVAATLTSLEFNQCRALARLDALAALERLQRLVVANCGDIESLSPVAGLPLQELHFYETTNIRDGQLDVLLGIPSLVNTSFANRRHYSHTREAIQQAVAARH